MLLNAGIKEIFFRGSYPDELALSLLQEGDVKINLLK